MDFSAALIQYLAGISIRALAVAAVAMALLAAFRVRSAASRHAVWSMVAAGMLMSAVLSPLLPPLPVRILPAAAPSIAAEAPPGDAQTVQSSASGARAASRPHPIVWTWQSSATALYLAGLFFFALRLAVSYLFTRRLMRASFPAGRELAQDLYESAWISVPMTAGLIHPKIFLPADWPQWEQAKLDAVLAHERTHVRRADWAIGVMAAANRCVFWFHPLSWWLERKLALLAEEACDDAALLLLGERENYAQALLDMAAAVRSGQGRLVWEAMAMAKASEVKHRIERILDETRQIPRGLTRPRLAALLACSLPLIYVSSVLQLAHVQAQEPQPRVFTFTSKDGAVSINTFREDAHITATDAATLEQQLKTNPEDQQTRGKLLDYYFQNGIRESRLEHVLWLIQNHPESPLLDQAPAWRRASTPADYQRAAALWREQIPQHLNQARVLGNAAHFFSDPAADPAEAERLYQQARTLEPANRAWLDRLAGLYVNSIIAANRSQMANSQFAADAALRLENSTDAALLSSVGRGLSTFEVGPGQSRAEALAKVSPALTPIWELGDRLLARAQQLGAPRRVTAADAEANAKRVDPVYPPLAMQARIQGVVYLDATVAQDGTVKNLQAVSGHPLLIPAAMEAVRQWTFGPRDTGQHVEVEVPFRLPESQGAAIPADRGGKKAAPVIGYAQDLPELQPLTRTDPAYPPLARQARISGVVNLIATIGVDGRVVDLMAASGHPLLIPSALTAARQWTYSPQTEPTRTRLQIQFELNR